MNNINSALSIDLFKKLLQMRNVRYLKEGDNIQFIVRGPHAVEDISSIMIEILSKEFNLEIKNISSETDESRGMMKIIFAFDSIYRDLIMNISLKLTHSEYLIVNFGDTYPFSAMIINSVRLEENEVSDDISPTIEKNVSVGFVCIDRNNYIVKSFDVSEFLEFTKYINSDFESIEYNILGSTKDVNSAFYEPSSYMVGDLYLKADKSTIASELIKFMENDEIINVDIHINILVPSYEFSTVDETLDIYREIHKHIKNHLHDIHARGDVYSIVAETFDMYIPKKKYCSFVFPNNKIINMSYVNNASAFLNTCNFMYSSDVIGDTVNKLVSSFLMNHQTILYEGQETDTRLLLKMKKWKDFSSEILPYLNDYLRISIYTKSVEEVMQDFKGASKTKIVISRKDHYPVFFMIKLNDKAFFSLNQSFKFEENEKVIQAIAEIMSDSTGSSVSVLSRSLSDHVNFENKNMLPRSRSSSVNRVYGEAAKRLFNPRYVPLTLNDKLEIEYRSIDSNFSEMNREDITLISNEGTTMEIIDDIELLHEDHVFMFNRNDGCDREIMTNMILNLLSGYEEMSDTHLKLILSELNAYTYIHQSLFKYPNMLSFGDILVAVPVSEIDANDKTILYHEDFDKIKGAVFNALNPYSIMQELETETQPLLLNNMINNRIRIIVPKNVQLGSYMIGDSENYAKFEVDEHTISLKTKRMGQTYMVNKFDRSTNVIELNMIDTEFHHHADVWSVKERYENEIKVILNLGKIFGFTKIDLIE